MKAKELQQMLVEMDNISEDHLDHIIMNWLATQEDVIPRCMRLLEIERKHSKEVRAALNLNLSRAAIHIQEKAGMTDEFVLGEIKKFYQDKRTDIRSCFILWPGEQDGFANFKERKQECDIYNH